MKKFALLLILPLVLSLVTVAAQKKEGWSTTETVLQIHGKGPFEIKYVNPADDPRNAKK
jgi:hypothetical protein